MKNEFKMLDFGLYRDDGIAVHDKIGGRNMKKIRQGLHQLFKSFGLRITIEPPNTKIVNFLDVRLNLTSNTVCPYKKPNDTTMFVHIKFNHLPTVLKEVLKSINNRLSKISTIIN